MGKNSSSWCPTSAPRCTCPGGGRLLHPSRLPEHLAAPSQPAETRKLAKVRFLPQRTKSLRGELFFPFREEINNFSISAARIFTPQDDFIGQTSSRDFVPAAYRGAGMPSTIPLIPRERGPDTMWGMETERGVVFA